MIAVNQATKDAWLSEVSQKHIKITVTGVGTIDESNIEMDTFEIAESIMSSESIEFVGCIARKLSFTTDGFNSDYMKNKRIKAWVKANDTQWISVFSGIIDESVKTSVKGLKSIVAYDDFYRLSLMDASKWWNDLGITTIYNSFLSFVQKFNLDLYVSWFVNGSYPCFGGTKKHVKDMSALDYLQQLCQINGVIGYIDGDGIFRVMHLSEAGTQTISWVKEFEYEDYDVNPLDRIMIRDTSDAEGIFYPYTGQNTYIIQGNIFAYDQTATNLLQMAKNIHDEVEDISFKPFSAQNTAYPWVECGDKVTYTDVDDEGVEQTVTVMVVSRTLSGHQFMHDTFSAEGEQDQRVFITDLSAQVEDLQNQIDDEEEEREDINYRGIVLVEFTDVPETEVLGGISDVEYGIASELDRQPPLE